MARGAGNYRRFTDAEKVEMARLRNLGYSNRKIAETLDEKNVQRISDWLKPSRVRSFKRSGFKGGPLPPVPSPESSIPWPTKAQLMGRR